ncbi:MAG: ATP-binding protein [Spirochaetia bacterium]|nr:ATP-binding protein [Spirochaetia bacterium]
MNHLKNIFDKLPLRNKLILIQFITISFALILSSAGSVYIYKEIAEEKLKNSIKSTAHTIAENLAATLIFNDKKSAESTLINSLDEHKGILKACIYTFSNKLFTSYKSINENTIQCNKDRIINDQFITSYKDQKIFYNTIISFNSEVVGYLQLISDRTEIKESTLRFFEIALIAFIVMMIISFYLSLKAKDLIMTPIKQLTNSIVQVSKEKDYSHNIKHMSKDELGILAKEFNEMLLKIKKRENSLKKNRDQLEKKVIERTEELHKATENAIQASKAKSEFLAKMSHEIRTPMNAILGFAEVLSEELKRSKNKKYISYILSSANSLLNIIDDILDLSKVEAGKLEIKENIINLKEIYEETALMFETKIKEKNLKLYIKHDSKLPKLVLLDNVRIKQILINLLNNAIKFTDKGFIELSTIVENGKEPFQKNLTLSVKDTGIGIPKDQQKKIFEQFTQKEGQDHSKYGGTGLGLSIIKQLAALMDGEIILNSTVNKGSTFSVRLNNIFYVSKEVKSKQVQLIKNTKFENKKILIVDDVEGNRKLLKAYFNNSKISIIEAENGKKAISLCEKELPDIVLMDLVMPVMGGEEAINILKNNNKTKSIPILVLSASGMKSDEERLKIKCDGYLTKPINKNKLFLEIDKFLN